MKFSHTGWVPESALRQYLLGNLQREECERLDELSISDDEFAERLCAAENDLVDAYVRQQLRGSTLRDFESHYLATDVRRQKVALARALLSVGAGPAGERGFSGARPEGDISGNRPSPRRTPQLRFALFALAAMLVLSVPVAWLAIENHRLREQNRAFQAEHGALEEQLRQVRAQADNQRALQNNPAHTAAEGTPRDIGHPAQLISSIFLLPPTRGAATVPVASVPEGDRWLRLQLALESDDFSRYQVSLMDLASNKYAWRSDPLKSVNVNRQQVVSLLLPVRGLKSQRYAAEVSGLAADGHRELLGNYVFAIAQSSSPQDQRR